jgi:uncharacterized oligopeptide transporter (OPT) family protein
VGIKLLTTTLLAAAFVREVVETLLYAVKVHHVRDFYADVYSIPVASMRIQLEAVDCVLIPTWSSGIVPDSSLCFRLVFLEPEIT